MRIVNFMFQIDERGSVPRDLCDLKPRAVLFIYGNRRLPPMRLYVRFNTGGAKWAAMCRWYYGVHGVVQSLHIIKRTKFHT